MGTGGGAAPGAPPTPRRAHARAMVRLPASHWLRPGRMESVGNAAGSAAHTIGGRSRLRGGRRSRRHGVPALAGDDRRRSGARDGARRLTPGAGPAVAGHPVVRARTRPGRGKQAAGRAGRSPGSDAPPTTGAGACHRPRWRRRVRAGRAPHEPSATPLARAHGAAGNHRRGSATLSVCSRRQS